jgi:predicted HAD superfamily Cof-like phosphohydrolase
MNDMQNDVRIFHQTYGQPVGLRPQMLPEGRKGLRFGLIREEVDELNTALLNNDPVETYDAAIDILYVTFGLLVEMGMDAQAGFDEVQRSNLSKLGADGKPILSRGVELDGFPKGKVLKGPGYFRPDLAAVLRAQGLEI